MANTKELYQNQQECLNDLIARRIVTFQDNTKTLRNYAFFYNNNIKHLKFPKCTSIGNYGVFAHASNLEDIDFSQNISFYIANPYNQYDIFQGAVNLQHLILRSSTKCSITGEPANYRLFTTTPINYKNGVIYVPQNLVEQYKNDQYWGQYFIVPIQDTLLTTFDTIRDDWATIIRNCNLNNIDKYNIGDSKIFHINQRPYYAELVGKNVDTIAGAERLAPTTWITRQLYFDSRYFSDNNNSWASSTIRTDLNNENTGILTNNDAYAHIDETNLRNNIKKVYKISWNGSSQITTEDKIWIPSTRQIFGIDDYEKTGPTYKDFFMKNKYNRIKFITSSSEGSSLSKGQSYTQWLRSSYNSSSNAMYVINTSGALSNINRNNKIPYCFGFCI